jgi:hypothetical protein
MGNDLVEKDEDNVYQVMDHLDDSLIEAELENRIADTWVYSFSSGGKQQTGLSKVGVDECCNEMAKQGNIIREGKVEYQRDPISDEHVLFQGIATRVVHDREGNEAMMESVNGTKRQWVKMKLKDGKVVDDPFWFEKGSMKALRNAKSRLISATVRTKIIMIAKDKGRVRDVGSSESTEEESPKPTDDVAPGEPKIGDADADMTTPQRKKIWAMIYEQGLVPAKAKAFYDHMNPKTKGEAHELIENFDKYLKQWQDEIPY